MPATTLDVTEDRLEPFEQVISAEFSEMPGMRLTHAQFCRLWGLTEAECCGVLERLMKTGFLARGTDHRYHRRVDSFGQRPLRL
jgi:hypothetical protein